MLKLEVTPQGAAYLRYGVEGRVPTETLDISCDVRVDIDCAGDAITIEIGDVGMAESVEQARAFAEERGLPFPRKIDVP